MRARREEFKDIQIVIVTFADSRLLRGYQKRFASSFRVVSDPNRVLYAALGFGRGSVWRVWGARAAWRYVQLLRAGHRLEKTSQDTLQLGGNALIDQNGKLAWRYAGAGPDDRPSIEQILASIANLP